MRHSRGAGFLYVVVNKAWPGYCKLGRTFDLEKRLRAYQTASPKRDFAFSYHRHFQDVLAAERALKAWLPGLKAQGEWYCIHPDDAQAFIEKIPDK